MPLGTEPARDAGHLAAIGHDEVAAIGDRGPDPGAEEGRQDRRPPHAIGLEDDRPGIVEEGGREHVGDGRRVARVEPAGSACIGALSADGRSAILGMHSA